MAVDLLTLVKVASRGFVFVSGISDGPNKSTFFRVPINTLLDLRPVAAASRLKCDVSYWPRTDIAECPL